MLDGGDLELQFLERQTMALEVMGAGLQSIAAALHLFYARMYPAKGEVRDATVTHRQTDEEKVRADQGASGETDAEWIGRREQEFNARPERRRSAPKAQ